MDNQPSFRVRRYGAINPIGLKTLMLREVRRFMKVGGQTIAAPLVSTLLFMVVFTLALGERGAPSGQGTYADFLAPGLVMMAILTNAFANSSSSLIIAKMQGNAIDFLVPPLSAFELAAAFIGGAAARGLLVGVVGLIAVAPMADVTPVAPFAAAYFALIASAMFAAIGLLGGLWAEKFDHMATVTNFIVTPLTFLSGTFYSVEQLPAPFSMLAQWNPVFFLIDGFRFGMIGAADGDVAFGAVFTLILTLGLSWACFALLKSGYRLKS